MKDNELDTRPEETTSERVTAADEPLATADMAAAARRQQSVPALADDRHGGHNQEGEKLGTKADVQSQPDEGFAPLFDEGASTEFRSRWSSVQTGFVDDPRKAVQQADELVAAVMKRLAEVFAAERARMEADWSEGEEVSTEDLRIAFRRYRSFFDRLLSV